MKRKRKKEVYKYSISAMCSLSGACGYGIQTYGKGESSSTHFCCDLNAMSVKKFANFSADTATGTGNNCCTV